MFGQREPGVYLRVVIQAIEERRGFLPYLGLRSARWCCDSHPRERAPRGIHAFEIRRQRDTRRFERRLAQQEQIAARRFVDIDPERVKWLQGSTEATRALACAARERGDAPERLSEERKN